MHFDMDALSKVSVAAGEGTRAAAQLSSFDESFYLENFSKSKIEIENFFFLSLHRIYSFKILT